MEIIFLPKYLKSISSCGTTLTEDLLNMGRRPPTSKKARKSLGRAKENSFKKIQLVPRMLIVHSSSGWYKLCSHFE